MRNNKVLLKQYRYIDKQVDLNRYMFVPCCTQRLARPTQRDVDGRSKQAVLVNKEPYVIRRTAQARSRD